MAGFTDGFAFVEYTASDAQELEKLFGRLGFEKTWQHPSRDISAMACGDAIFFINAAPNKFMRAHGPSVRGIGIHVTDAGTVKAATEVVRVIPSAEEPLVVDVPAIQGIGDGLIYLVEETPARFARTFLGAQGERTRGIRRIDHSSNIVRPENLDRWADFYARNFGFSENQYLEVRGQASGMRARAMVGGCGRVSIPIAASAHTGKGVLNQNDEFIRDHRGEGIQHIALLTDDILQTVDQLRANGIEFMEPPPSAYYDALDERVSAHGLDVNEIRRHGVLVDGQGNGRILLQIFSRRQIGPVFFEFIERRGADSFGEGNFQALFEAQERDQAMRGSLKEALS